MANLRKLIIPAILLLLLFACKAKPQAGDAPAEQNIDQDAYGSSDPEPEQDTALQSYEYSWNESDDMPDVVIIIDDFGNSAGQLLADFGDLPPEIVFAVLPDLPHTRTAADTAIKGGHEVIIHIPMEAENSSINPGEKYIAKDMKAGEIQDILSDFVSQLPMAIAANNHMGSAATANRSTMNKVLSILKQEQLFFIDSATTAQSAVYTAAQEQGVFTARRDIFLDVPDVSDATLAKKIQDLGRYKGRREPVVIITHCHNREKLEALQKFITQITAMGIRIVSLRDAFPQPVS
jgi:uncharacterized protein